MGLLVQLLAGVILGLGLALAGMTSPHKVLAFLDVSGHWDPSLLFVLGSAVTVAACGYHWILKRPQPVLDDHFHISRANRVDAPLIIGSLLFGAGWGIAGYCPGPAVALLAVPGNAETGIFLGGLTIGIIVNHLICLETAAD